MAPPTRPPTPGRRGQALTPHLDVLRDLDELHLGGHVAQRPHALAQVPVADITVVVRVKLLEGGLKLCRGGRSGTGSQPDSETPPTRRSQRGHSPSSSSGPSSRSCRGIVQHVPGASQGSGQPSSSSPRPRWPGQGRSHKGRRRQRSPRRRVDPRSCSWGPRAATDPWVGGLVPPTAHAARPPTPAETLPPQPGS